MKNAFFSFLAMISCITLAHAEENAQCVYGTAQTIGGIPMVGMGVRTKGETHSIDISATELPSFYGNVFDPDIFHAKSLYLFYPMKEKGFYVGAGLGILTEPESIKGLTGSVESSIGYEWHSDNKAFVFLEANGILPFKKPIGADRVWPGISIGLGY